MSANQPASLPRSRPLGWLAILGPYMGLFVVLLLFSILIAQRGGLHLFLNWDNAKLMLVHAAIVAIVAVGMTLVIISGGIDLSVGYAVSLVTVITVLAYRGANAWLPGDPSIWAITAGIATGGLCGLANGVIITGLRIGPFVATLGTMGVVRGLAQYLADGQPMVFPNQVRPPGWVTWLGGLDPDPAWLLVSPGVWSVALVAAAAALLLQRTVLGRYCYALGSNEAATRRCGISVERTKIVIYILAGLVTGWAGIVQTARTRAGIFNIQAGLELEVIAAVVIGGGSLTGGQGTIGGTLIGALMLAVLDNGCSKLDLTSDFKFIVIGAIIVGVAALNSWRQRRLG